MPHPNLTLSRRNWMKKASLAGAGFLALPSLDATPTSPARSTAFREYHPSLEWERFVPFPKLKARLLANENPWGPSPDARLAIMESAVAGNRYQHEAANALRKEIASFEGVSEDHIVVAPGSSDILEKMAIMHYLEEGNLVTADPAYMSLIKTAQQMGAEWNKVKLAADWSHDLGGMASAIDKNTRLVYICNPNNPTGTLTDPDQLRDFCRTVSKDVPVFVDEAYLEFLPNPAEQTMVKTIQEGHNVIVARTFSKIHGMAGLRVGYGVMQPEMRQRVDGIWRNNMSLCKTSLMGAMASLKDKEFQAMSRKKTAAAREQTYAGLEKLGLEYVPSHTSFILFPLAVDGQAFLDDMFAHGVGVRVFDVHGKTHCRVSMGTPEEIDLFLESLGTVLAK
jgi:histidinol-phosphate aminotransferase